MRDNSHTNMIFLLPITEYYWIFSLLLVIFLIVGVIWWILCSLPPVIGATLGAIVAFFLASKHISDQEKEKIDVQSREKRKKIANGLIIELNHIIEKLNYINNWHTNFSNQNPGIFFFNQVTIDKCVQFVIQIQTFYSTKRYMVINSINNDLGIFNINTMKKILTVYYELNLLNEKFSDITSNMNNNKFAPELINQLPGLNSRLKIYIVDLKNDLEEIVQN